MSREFYFDPVPFGPSLWAGCQAGPGFPCSQEKTVPLGKPESSLLVVEEMDSLEKEEQPAKELGEAIREADRGEKVGLQKL